MKEVIRMAKLKVVWFVSCLVTFTLVSFSQTIAQKTEDILVLFNSYGILYTTIDKEFELPDGWNVLQVSASRWYTEKKSIQPEYFIPVELTSGKYKITGNMAISESGDKYVNTSFGLGKVINEGRTITVLKSSEKADALFSVPGGYRIYYTLKENTIEQFFEIKSPVDSAYVILSTAPEEGYVRVSYAKMAVESILSEEVTTGGRKIFILGYQEGLTNGLNLRNKILNIIRNDWNKIELNYTSTYNWQPADYVVEVKTTDELPAGQVYIYSTILGKSVPIGVANMPDINKEGEIYVSKSWQVYHSWTLTKMTKLAGRNYIVGELNLKGNGNVKLIIRGKSIAGLNVNPGSILKTASDYAEIKIPVSGVTKVSISFNYAE